MFKVGDYLMYRNEVCKVEGIKETNYILKSVNDNSLKIEIPMENKLGLLRNIISKEETEELINKIPEIETINTNDKLIENEYKNLLKTGKKEDLIKIIKTTYLRNDDRLKSGKKIGETDNNYFQKAEKILYSELSISLNKTIDETKEYIIEQLS